MLKSNDTISTSNYKPFIILLRLMASMPHGMQQFLGKKLGFLLPRLLKKRYRISEINLTLTNQPPETLENHWKSLGISLFETANALFASSTRIEQHLSISNPEVIQGLLDNKENIMLLVPHTTHMLLAGRCLLTKFPTYNIYRPQNNQAFNHFMTKAYTDNGASLINTNDPRGIIGSMKSGVPVWYAPDADLTNKHIFAPFYGVPTSTLIATKKLSDMAKAYIVPLSFIRKDAEYILSFGQPFKLNELSVQEAGARVNRELEALINKAPEQYYWVHKRFKTTPDGKDHYA